jgi:hypothetical protein
MQLNEDLLQSTKAAVRRTLAVVRVQQPKESLVGYALLTDDDLVTLTYMAITKEALASDAGDDLLFTPTDWPYEYDSDAFDTPNEHLQAMYESKSPEHVDVAFDTLVQALAELRVEGLFSPEIFLSVLSTDPGPYLQALEDASLERLNDVNMVERRARFLERWTTSR